MADWPQDERASQLEAFLRAIAEGIDWLRAVPVGWQYGSIEMLVLEQGRWFTPRLMPDPALIGPPKGCFRNAALLAITMPGLAYVEGYGITGAGFPILHAWCVEVGTGLVFDPTWPWGLEADLRVSDGALVGIAFPIEAVIARQLAADGEASMLDAWMLRHPAQSIPAEGWGDKQRIIQAYKDADAEYRDTHPDGGWRSRRR